MSVDDPSRLDSPALKAAARKAREDFEHVREQGHAAIGAAATVEGRARAVSEHLGRAREIAPAMLKLEAEVERRREAEAKHVGLVPQHPVARFEEEVEGMRDRIEKALKARRHRPPTAAELQRQADLARQEEIDREEADAMRRAGILRASFSGYTSAARERTAAILASETVGDLLSRRDELAIDAGHAALLVWALHRIAESDDDGSFAFHRHYPDFPGVFDFGHLVELARRGLLAVDGGITVTVGFGALSDEILRAFRDGKDAPIVPAAEAVPA